MADHIEKGVAIMGAHETIEAAQAEARMIKTSSIRTVSVYKTPPMPVDGVFQTDGALFFNVAADYPCPCCGYFIEEFAPS